MLSDKEESKDLVGELENVEATLAAARERAVALAKEVDELEQKFRIARGTERDVEAPPPAPKPKPLTLVGRIEEQLRRQIMTTGQLAKALGESEERVFTAIRTVRPKVVNLGSPERARWSWRVGSDVPAPELRALIERLLMDQPMSFRDIIQATGAREGLIQGALVDIRRARTDIYDLGTPSRARWFILMGARNAHLEPRRSKE